MIEDDDEDYPLVTTFTSNIITALSALTTTKATIGIDLDMLSTTANNTNTNSNIDTNTTGDTTNNTNSSSNNYDDDMKRTIKERNEALSYIALASNVITHGAIHRSVMSRTIAGLEVEVSDLRSIVDTH